MSRRLDALRMWIVLLGAAALVASCAYERPSYVPPPPATITEDLYADPGRCGYDEWRAYEVDRERLAAAPQGESLAMTRKLVALGREVALIGGGKVQLLDADAKSLRPLYIPDRVVDAARVGSRIWLLTRPPGRGVKPARVWSYARGTLQLASELPLASCKVLLAIGGAGETITVVADRWVASSTLGRGWRLNGLNAPTKIGWPSFVCLDATHCWLGVARREWGGDLLAIDVGTGKAKRPRDWTKSPDVWCGSNVMAIIADPTNASCALVATAGYSGGCVDRVCTDNATRVFARHRDVPEGIVAREDDTETVYGLSTRERRLFAVTRSGVYEFGDGQEQSLPWRFEPLADGLVSYEVPGLVVIATRAVYGGEVGTPLIAVLDEK